MIRSALLSEDGVYRYVLTRDWTDEAAGIRSHIVWVLLNPSTADATVDDPTVRRCIGFSQRWGYSSMSIINLFAYRATKPADLRELTTPIATGPQNLDAWKTELAKADWIMAGWGSYAHGHSFYSLRSIAPKVTRAGLYCFGRTASGQPRHPLYLPNNARPIGY